MKLMWVLFVLFIVVACSPAGEPVDPVQQPTDTVIDEPTEQPSTQTTPSDTTSGELSDQDIPEDVIGDLGDESVPQDEDVQVPQGPNPQISWFGVDDDSLDNQDPVTQADLIWSAEHATRCEGSGDWSAQDLPGEGSYTITGIQVPQVFSNTYILTCYGAQGTQPHVMELNLSMYQQIYS